MAIDMNNIMKASFGEASSTIRASFKKTINVKQYETEVIEMSSTLEMEKSVTGVERMIISAILQAQLEYDAYIQMRCKGVIGDTQLAERRNELEQDINLLKTKGEQLLGKPLDYLFDIAPEKGAE